jgi:HlyD family secretion protein
MKKMVGRLTFLAASLTSLLALASCGTEEVAQARPAHLTAVVKQGDLVIRADATGTVEPVRKVDVKSKASGEILHLHADVGDRVARGTLLAEIDPRDVTNTYNQAQADLEVAQARLEISQAQLTRSQQLLDAQVITQQEHESARLDYTNAQAALVRARTSHALAQLQLNDVRIVAPMDGTIIQKNVEEGVVIQSASQNVSGGTTLFVMADLADMQVRTLVDETDMGMLKAGMSASVAVEAFPDNVFQGVIEKIEPQAVIEQNVTMFPVIVSMDNRSGLLKPGMNADVNILIDEAFGVLMVPNNAIVKTSDVGPAALALGLDIAKLDLTQFMQAGGGTFAAAGGGRTGGSGGQRVGGGGGQRVGGGGGQRAGGGGGQRNGGGRTGGAQPSPEVLAQMQQLRSQAESGAISQDSLRAAMQALRGNGAVGQAAGAQAQGAGTEGAVEKETRPAAVFVVHGAGQPEPRLIQMGIGDWDNTQIVSGVEAGDTLIIVGAAQLQAQQQAFLEQVRGRMGGSNPFGGNIPGQRGGFPGGGGGRRGGG